MNRSQRAKVKSEETIVLYEDNEAKIIVPKTLAAAQLYGRSTVWCVKRNHHFHKYSLFGNLIMIIRKKEDNRKSIYSKVITYIPFKTKNETLKKWIPNVDLHSWKVHWMNWDEFENNAEIVYDYTKWTTSHLDNIEIVDNKTQKHKHFDYIKGYCRIITSDGRVIVATGNQNVFVYNGEFYEWRTLKDLKESDSFVRYDKEIVGIEEIEFIDEYIETCNIALEDSPSNTIIVEGFIFYALDKNNKAGFAVDHHVYFYADELKQGNRYVEYIDEIKPNHNIVSCFIPGMPHHEISKATTITKRDDGVDKDFNWYPSDTNVSANFLNEDFVYSTEKKWKLSKEILSLITSYHMCRKFYVENKEKDVKINLKNKSFNSYLSTLNKKKRYIYKKSYNRYKLDGFSFTKIDDSDSVQHLIKNFLEFRGYGGETEFPKHDFFGLVKDNKIYSVIGIEGNKSLLRTTTVFCDEENWNKDIVKATWMFFMKWACENNYNYINLGPIHNFQQLYKKWLMGD